ncbi:DUF4019 domain-containing protein [Massilia agri]|uniref:DUF4019 domain-containing protein n=1 Tax=Massilia agri TaxID=1886785 RepID=A0ABT2AGF1_9BURK|nr:DUF4019 domain-containing protein [Massilia agri]MCS0595281.1 DUF4019 domain-containing protein [Massilia agri]
MKTIVSAVLTASLLLGATAMAQDTKDTAAARAAAESWLKLVDNGDTGAAWRASSANVRKDTNQFFWGSIINVSRATLGDLKSRKLKGSSEKGKGQLAFEYDSKFKSDSNVTETVTTVHEKDGSWRVSGYNVSASN